MLQLLIATVSTCGRASPVGGDTAVSDSVVGGNGGIGMVGDGVGAFGVVGL